MTKRLLLLFCCMLTVVLTARAQTMHYREFPFASKLPSNEMTRVYQDRTGYIWIGTTNGAARYDGYSLLTFDTESSMSPGYSGKHISAFAEDSTHIWIGSSMGLSLMDRNGCLTPMDNRLCATSVNAMCDDGENTVWVAIGADAYAFQGIDNCTDSLTLPECDGDKPEILQLMSDRQQRLWICTDKGLFVYSSSSRELKTLPRIGKHNSPCDILQDKAGRMWIATWGDGLWQLIEKEGVQVTYKKQNIPSSPLHGDDLRFFSLAEDDAFGYYWALSYNKLHAFRYDAAMGELLPVNLPKEVDTDKMYTRILKDRHGSLWVSSYDQGGIVSFTDDRFTHYAMPELAGEIGREPNLLTLDLYGEGQCWFIEDRFGLCHYSLTAGEVISADPLVQSLTIDSRVTTISRKTGEIWVAAPGGTRIGRFKAEDGRIVQTGTVRLTSQEAGDWITQMKENQSGGLWALYRGGLYYVPKEGEPYKVETADAIETFCIIPENGNVLAASGRQIYMLTPDGNGVSVRQWGSAMPLKDNSTARFISVDGTNNVWVATNRGEILRSAQRGGQWRYETALQQAKDMPLLNMLVSGRHVWLVYPYKAVCYDIASGGVNLYSSTDNNAVRTLIFRDQAACLSPKGGLYAGGTGGIIRIQQGQKNITGDSMLSNVVPTDICVEGQSVLTSHVDGCRFSDRGLELHDSHKDVAVSLSNFIFHTPVRLAYRLEGKDTVWHQLPAGENTAHLQHLDADRYELWVRATDQNGEWDEEQMVLHIESHAAWHSTWWAYIIYIVIVVLTVALILRIRNRRITQTETQPVQNSEEVSLNTVSVPDSDKQFMQQLADCIHEHLSDTEFGVDQLATEMSVSKSTLRRRVKTATGSTPLDFIRDIKLKYACMMLRQGAKTVSEVAYATGFSSPKYFTRCFKEVFNMTPTEYSASEQNNPN